MFFVLFEDLRKEKIAKCAECISLLAAGTIEISQCCCANSSLWQCLLENYDIIKMFIASLNGSLVNISLQIEVLKPTRLFFSKVLTMSNGWLPVYFDCKILVYNLTIYKYSIYGGLQNGDSNIVHPFLIFRLTKREKVKLLSRHFVIAHAQCAPIINLTSNLSNYFLN